MATNNEVNIKSSGIVSYDGAGTFSALANPLIVSNGGTGNSSLTAYAVVCGGTTGTGALQSIVSVGSSGHVLTSNGASSLPSFQADPGTNGDVAMRCQVGFMSSISSSTNYLFWGGFGTWGTTDISERRCYIPVAGTITAAYVDFQQGVFGTTETSTVSIRLNNTSDTTISSSVQNNTARTVVSNTGLSISVSAGDYISIKWATPSWSFPPGNIRMSATVMMTPS